MSGVTCVLGTILKSSRQCSQYFCRNFNSLSTLRDLTKNNINNGLYTSRTAWSNLFGSTHQNARYSQFTNSLQFMTRKSTTPFLIVRDELRTSGFSKSISTSGQDSEDMKVLSNLDNLFINGIPHKKKKKPNRMNGQPQIKGVVVKTLIKKPRKPNSANRRCCKVRLSNGKTVIAFIPGEGHNLQEHNVVLLHTKRCKDLIGVQFRVIRGKYDCAHVVKPSS